LNVLGRRFGTVRVTIYPVRVQGEGAARQIANAIGRLNARGGLDVLIITRGGGSAEDLAPFNDESVARALAASRIPTISAVGHETDVTICDLVADLRAPTPSSAAELVAEKKAELCRRVEEARGRILRSTRSILGLTRARLSGLSRAEGLLRFRYHLRELSGRVAQSRGALVTALERRPAEYAGRLARARASLAGFLRSIEFPRKRETVARLRALLLERGRRRLERRRERLRRCAEKLELVSPLAVLARGYAVAYREGSKTPLLSASRVKPGDGIRVRLHEGEIGALVRERKGASPETAEALGPLFAEGKGRA
jgi:exodeoxyribonuclease VII large subunit